MIPSDNIHHRASIRGVKHRVALFAILACAILSSGHSTATAQFSTKDAISGAGTAEAAQKVAQSLGVAEWLGPLAPVALSPFFGIACLSGMALYGPSWISPDNPMVGSNSPLANPAVFWVFLALTVFTSLPRLTKVSKPMAQAIDRLEAWAGIITMLVLKVMVSGNPIEDFSLPGQAFLMQAGLLTFGADTLLMLAAVINIFVINAVKFFFEILIWLTPVPAIDAVFEVCNKSLCAALMAVYGYSPTLATGINLAMFTVAAFVFRWAYRREVFLQNMVVDAGWRLFRRPSEFKQDSFAVFPTSAVGNIPLRARCRLTRTETGWNLQHRRWLRSALAADLAAHEYELKLVPGFFTNSLEFTGPQSVTLTFSRWNNDCLEQVAAAFGADFRSATSPVDRTAVKMELA